MHQSINHCYQLFKVARSLCVRFCKIVQLSVSFIKVIYKGFECFLNCCRCIQVDCLTSSFDTHSSSRSSSICSGKPGGGVLRVGVLFGGGVLGDDVAGGEGVLGFVVGLGLGLSFGGNSLHSSKFWSYLQKTPCSGMETLKVLAWGGVIEVKVSTTVAEILWVELVANFP